MKFKEYIIEGGIEKAINQNDFIQSIANGRFTKDGRDLTIDFDLYIDKKGLTSLEYFPDIIGKDCSLSGNKLKTLIGGPSEVGDHFAVGGNKLTSLEGAPKSIGGEFYAVNNKLKSLHNIHLYIQNMDGRAAFIRNPIASHVLGLLKIAGLTKVVLDNTQVQNIINKYLPLGDVLDCQEELIEAGYEEYAQL